MAGMLARKLASPTVMFSRNVINMTQEFESTFKPTSFQKWLLVFSHAYKNKKEVPDRIRWGQLRKAYDLLRARVTNWLTFYGLAGVMLVTYIEQHHYEQHLATKRARPLDMPQYAE